MDPKLKAIGAEIEAWFLPEPSLAIKWGMPLIVLAALLYALAVFDSRGKIASGLSFVLITIAAYAGLSATYTTVYLYTNVEVPPKLDAVYAAFYGLHTLTLIAGGAITLASYATFRGVISGDAMHSLIESHQKEQRQAEVRRKRRKRNEKK